MLMQLQFPCPHPLLFQPGGNPCLHEAQHQFPGQQLIGPLRDHSGSQTDYGENRGRGDGYQPDAKRCPQHDPYTFAGNAHLWSCYKGKKGASSGVCSLIFSRAFYFREKWDGNSSICLWIPLRHTVVQYSETMHSPNGIPYFQWDAAIWWATKCQNASLLRRDAGIKQHLLLHSLSPNGSFQMGTELAFVYSSCLTLDLY